MQTAHKRAEMGIGQRVQVKLVPFSTNPQAGTGRVITTELPSIGLWAEVRNPSGFRDYSNGLTELGRTKIFTIRWRGFNQYPNQNWMLHYEGREWTVTSVLKVDEKRFYYDLTATSKRDVQG